MAKRMILILPQRHEETKVYTKRNFLKTLCETPCDFVAKNYTQMKKIDFFCCNQKTTQQQSVMKNKKALLIGASGLIGNEILKQLQSTDYSSIELLVRNKFDIQDTKITQRVVDFNQPETWESAFENADHVFCSIGTTRKKTPNLSDYRKIDFDIPVNAIKAAEKYGVDAFMLVSSVGADSASKNFYLKIKGEVEDVLKDAQIPIKGSFQPSLLLGNRKEKRFGEWIARKIMPVFNFIIPSAYKAIQANDVARAMVVAIKNQKTSYQEYQYKEMQNLIKSV